MSLATRCTACGTIFRVVQDQLRVSEGWVRCGRCAEVFDANEQLFDIDREAPPPWPPQSAALAPDLPTPTPAHEPAHAPAQAVAAEEATWVMSPAASGTDEVFAAPPAARHPDDADLALDGDFHPAAPRREPAVEQVEAHEPTIQLPPIYADGALPAEGGEPERVEPFWSAEPEAPATPSSEEPSRGKRKKGGKPFAEEAADPAAIEAEPDSSRAAAVLAASAATAGKPMPQPSFLRAAERQSAAASRWQRPGVRIGLALASLLLLLMLAVQALWQFRNALLAVYPPSAPLLRSFCDLAGCSLEPWKRIDALAVETSSLTQAGSGNNYKLSIQLQNKAGYALALPWVDLSLTDASGALVARRMLKPADFNLSKTSIAAQSEEALQLVFSTDKLKVSGYSVVIFHP